MVAQLKELLRMMKTNIYLKRKRLVNDVDPQDSVTLNVVNQSYIPKFCTTSTNYKITCNSIKVDNLRDILITLRKLFQSIINNIT